MDDNEVPTNGWAPRGQRCRAKKKAFRKSRLNMIASLNLSTLFAPFLFEGYTTTSIYETYVEQVLLPVLKPGTVFIIDNARFHTSKKTLELIQSAGCRILFLPPYSPDFNPIEHCWAAIKSAIRKAAEKKEDFFEAAVSTLGDLCTT